MNTRRAMRLDGKALALAHASPFLALDSRAVGQPVALAATSPGLPRVIGDDVTEPTVALVRVLGPIAQRAQADLCGYLDGYDAITARLEQALADDRVDAVVLVIDSPGGDAAGCWEAVARMRALVASSGKPVYAYADELAASAAYAVATVASKIFIPASGEVGSIGVIAVHFDESASLEAEGVKPTIFRSGPRKAEGSPLEALTDAAARSIATRVDDLADQFGALVAWARGGTAAKWLSLEGDVFAGEKAVAAGLADGIASLEDVIAKAASAAKGQKSMSMDKALAAALGVSPDASVDDLRAVAKAAEVGRAVALMTGDKGPAEALATVNLWRAANDKVATLEADALAKAETAEKAERHDLALKLIEGKRLFPAEVWKKGEDGAPSPAAGVKKAWSTETLRLMAASVGAGPHPIVRESKAALKDESAPTEADAKAARAAGVSVESYVASRNEIKAANRFGAAAEGTTR